MVKNTFQKIDKMLLGSFGALKNMKLDILPDMTVIYTNGATSSIS